MRAKKYIDGLTVLLVLTVFSLSWANQAFSQTSCNYYASPAGTGNGSSSSQPFKIANFWAVAKPGHTLCLLDGQYTGSASMINPPQNLSGTASAPITVRAINDGKVTIHGQGVFRPVLLYYNNYFILENFNARNSAASVVALSNSNNNVVRRVAAWDAADGNTVIFSVNYGTHNLLEDVAGWGIARKIFSASQAGNYTTIRRAWGRWEGSHVVGPKMTYTLAYNNYNMICENCIGTWSGERMKQTYTLVDYYGQPWTGTGAGTYSNYSVDQPYGIFSNDGLANDKNARTKLLGSIAYLRGTDRFQASQAVFITKLDSIELTNAATFIEPGSHTNKRPFALYNLQTSTASNLVARKLTSIASANSYYGTEWQKGLLSEGTTLSAVTNPFLVTSTGANLCYRYHAGALTSQPLWPWPMNQRIIDAMAQSGRNSVDVTATVEKMFGPIPAACRGSDSTTPSSIPSAPVSLVVGP